MGTIIRTYKLLFQVPPSVYLRCLLLLYFQYNLLPLFLYFSHKQFARNAPFILSNKNKNNQIELRRREWWNQCVHIWFILNVPYSANGFWNARCCLSSCSLTKSFRSMDYSDVYYAVDLLIFRCGCYCCCYCCCCSYCSQISNEI